MGNLAGDSPHIPHTSPISDCSYSHKWGIWGNLWGVPKITPHLSKPLYIGFSSNLGGISQKRYISKFLKIAFILSHSDVSLILFTISWWLCVLHHTSSIRHQTSKSGSVEPSPLSKTSFQCLKDRLAIRPIQFSLPALSLQMLVAMYVAQYRSLAVIGANGLVHSRSVGWCLTSTAICLRKT
jgi:hypothetical protein